MRGTIGFELLGYVVAILGDDFDGSMKKATGKENWDEIYVDELPEIVNKNLNMELLDMFDSRGQWITCIKNYLDNGG